MYAQLLFKPSGIRLFAIALYSFTLIFWFLKVWKKYMGVDFSLYIFLRVLYLAFQLGGQVLCILKSWNIIAYHFQTSIHFFEDLKRNKEKLKITKRIIGRRCLRKSHSFKPSEIKMLIYFQIYFLMKKRDAMWKTIGRKRKEQKSLFSNEVFKCFSYLFFRGKHP